MIENCLKNVREKKPLVQNITNYVTVNDVANIELAVGASPIMSDEPLEMNEIQSASSCLNVNIGTLNERTIEAMKIAIKRANELGHPVVLDPVGIGVSHLRTETVKSFLNDFSISVIKGNMSEIKALASGESGALGVDAGEADRFTMGNIDEAVKLVKTLAKNTGAVVSATGEIDIISDGEKAILVRNGRPEMEAVTGAGCMLSGLTASFIGANPEAIFEATATSVIAMGLAGEIAFKKQKKSDGNASLRNKIIDAIYNMDEKTLVRGAKYEIK